MSTLALHAGNFARAATGGPKKVDEAFWNSYAEFLKILHQACPPEAIVEFFKRTMKWHKEGFNAMGVPRKP